MYKAGLCLLQPGSFYNRFILQQKTDVLSCCYSTVGGQIKNVKYMTLYCSMLDLDRFCSLDARDGAVQQFTVYT